jgi:3-oxoacyl-[acyl-carrier-protein] synthase-1
VAGASRPGPRFEGTAQEFANDLLASLQRWARQANLTVIDTGNTSVIHGLKLAAARLAEDPSSVCIVGGIDSLLSLETLNWYETAERLKSGSVGRNHGLSPAEGVGFLVVETAASAQRESRGILAEVAGIGLATESDPFFSERPSRGQGLTEACRTALAASAIPLGEVGTVLCDLDGEFHRAKEWALAELRCFGNAGARTLLHPADCLGSVGAASAALLISIAAVAFSRRWFTKPVLVFCSDDAGECGAVVLTLSGVSGRHY